MHTVTGKLNKPARVFQAGESTGFGVSIGVKYRDPQTKQTEWTNYQAAIFAKSPAQIDYYTQVLVEGAIVSIGAENQRVKAFDGQNGQILTIDMLNARLTYAFNSSAQQPAPQSQGGYGQQQAPQQPAQPAYNERPAPPPQAPINNADNFDDDLPF